MTPAEVVMAIRMLTDDYSDWILGKDGDISPLLNIIDEAQLRRLAEFYKTQNERALRTLYVKAIGLPYGSLISDFLYPRACKVSYLSSGGANYGSDPSYAISNASYPKDAIFLEPDVYMNITQPSFGAGERLPRVAYYTIIANKLYFTQAHPQNAISYIGNAEFWYIKRPNLFLFNPNELS